MYAVLLVIGLILFLINYCIIYKTSKLSFISKIKSKYLKVFISFVPLIIFVVFMFLDRINTIIVYIYILLFFIMFDFVFYIIKKIIKKSISYDSKYLISIIITTLYLSYSFFNAYHIVETTYKINTNKNIGLDNFRIVQISDSHIGVNISGDRFMKYMDVVNSRNPDIVVITGDFIDDDTSFDDMVKACIGLGKLKTKYGVYFVYGNHDKGYFNYRGYSDVDLEKELIKNNVIILNDDVMKIDNNIILVGRKDASFINRLSSYELTKNIDKNKYIIMLDHQPNDYENEKKSNVDLVLSGHTHGGQFFPIGQIAVLLGINDNRYGLEKINIL